MRVIRVVRCRILPFVVTLSRTLWPDSRISVDLGRDEFIVPLFCLPQFGVASLVIYRLLRPSLNYFLLSWIPSYPFKLSSSSSFAFTVLTFTGNLFSFPFSSSFPFFIYPVKFLVRTVDLRALSHTLSCIFGRKLATFFHSTSKPGHVIWGLLLFLRKSSLFFLGISARTTWIWTIPRFFYQLLRIKHPS